MTREHKAKMRIGRLLTEVIERHVTTCGFDERVEAALNLERELRKMIGDELRKAWEAGRRGEA